MSGYDVVVMGASWGGMRALETVLAALPADFPVPIAIAQHRDPDAEDDLLASLLARHTRLDIHDADDKQQLAPGRVLLAPPGYHMLIEGATVALSVDAPVQFARPSIDVLFESAADAHGARTIGVVLTGANADGAAGLAAIKRRGGHTIVQAPDTAERPEMPRAAAAIGPDRIVALDEIAPCICAACDAEVAA